MRNKKWIWILVIILAAVGGGYYYFTTTQAAAEAPTDTPSVQTAVARRGDLVVFASAAGQVIPAAEIGVGFDESGTLIELLVQVGEKVTAGQVLARLQTNQTAEEIALSIADAELNVLKMQQALDAIYSSAEMDAAQALRAVEEAETALETLQDIDLGKAEALQAVAEAEQAVADAERAYNNVRATASNTSINAAYAELVLAEERLQTTEDNFKPYASKPDDNLIKANLQLKLSSAQSAYDSALRTYNALTSTGSEIDKTLTEAELTTAQAKLAAAQQHWEDVQAGPTPGELALAKANLSAAQATWDILQNGPDPDAVALAKANLANAEAKFALAQEDQEIVELAAPINGTIMAIDGSIGEKLGTSTFVTVADLNQPYLEIYLDETDMNMVGINYEIEVAFDALPDDTFKGHVVEIDPSLQSVGGVKAVRVLAQLDLDSFAKPQTLPVGLNASVDVIGGRAQDAVLVPVEALREIAPGEYAVFVMENDEPILRIVTVGLIDFTSAEITSGLNPGEVVTTGIVDTN